MSFRNLLLFLTVLASAATARAAEPSSSLAGHWEGAVTRLGSVQIVHLDFREEGGRLTGTAEVPALGLSGLPVEQIRYEPPALRFKFLYGEPAITVDAEREEMTGLIEAWEPDVRIHLKREMAPPPAFREEQAAFRNGEVSLTGTLLRPLTSGPHPAVVLVHGSAQGGRSDARYRSEAALFARHGIAALIYDKRAGSESATFDDLAGDAAAAVRFLQSREGIDPRKIGLAGYSQGGWLAPMAAARADGVAFLILVNAPAVSVEEQEIQRVAATLSAEGASEEDVARAVAYTERVFGAAYRGGSWEELAAATAKAKSASWAGTVQLAESPEDLEGWRRQRFDPAPILRKTTVPVLALFGESDTVVPPAGNVEPLRKLLAEAGNQDVTVKVFPRAHHGIEQYGELRQGSWSWPTGYWVWGRRAPGYEETLIGWVRGRTPS
jgi:pimeloyl-ACP methyl ester carboxylesterase